jgi:hypothetical protein
MKAALDLLDGRHQGEKPLWLRWSHPGTLDEMLEAWHRYSNWWRRAGPAVDLLGVIDRGSGGQQVWHIHAYGYGPGIDLAEHAARWGRAGGYPFVKVERVQVAGADDVRRYLLRRLRGYLTAKQGARRLSLHVRR